MKRFFASDAESDMLIAEATKTFGLKIGDIINMAIKKSVSTDYGTVPHGGKTYFTAPYSGRVGSSGNQAVDDARYQSVRNAPGA